MMIRREGGERGGEMRMNATMQSGEAFSRGGGGLVAEEFVEVCQTG